MQTSAFEILGPIMVGPSSSHTAGALRIARVARSVAPKEVTEVTFTLYNSFARTYHGHGTDHALVAGMLGLDADDIRIRDSFDLAADAGLAYSFVEAGDDAGLHPNTVDVGMRLKDGSTLEVRGESVGGGRVRIVAIDGTPVEITGELVTLFVCHLDVPGVLAGLTGMLSQAKVNIATVHTYRDAPGGTAFSTFEVDEPLSAELLAKVADVDHVSYARHVTVPGVVPTNLGNHMTYDFDSAEQLLALCDDNVCSLGRAMRRREAELLGDEQAAEQGMHAVYDAMVSEIHATIDTPEPSLGGFLNGQAAAVDARGEALAPFLMGSSLTKSVAYAMATLERSATMGVIVAAPTAGSSGVVPGAVLGCAEQMEAPQAKVEAALWCAAAIGAIVSRNGSVSGAEGGCQAEVGTASAMAAAALTQMLYGSPAKCLDAAAIALGNVLGLVCDPVRGLVEYPCQDRNALGVVNAFSAAQLALSGITSPIPFDQVVDAMARVGRALPPSLRETALGGLAATPAAATACLGDSCASCGGCCS